MDFGYDYYDYGYGYAADHYEYIAETVFSVILAIYLIVLAVTLVFTLVDYIFHSIGLYTIGKRMGKDYPWLAFIPFARDYFHGELAGEIRLKNRKIKNPGIWNLVLPIVGEVISAVFILIAVFAGSIGIVLGSIGSGGVGLAMMFVIVMYVLGILLLTAANAARIVLLVLINKQILERFTTGNMALVHAVVSRFVPFYEAFCLFVMRDKQFNPGMEPEMKPPVPPVPPIPPVSPAGHPGETSDTEKTE